MKRARLALPFKPPAKSFAQSLGVSHQVYSNWERGRNDPPLDRLNEIAELLAISRLWLETGEGPMSYTGNSLIVRRAGIRSIPVYNFASYGLPKLVSGEAMVSDWIDVKDWGSDRTRWGRRVESRAMMPMLLPGDIAIFEDRPPEPRHVVQAVQENSDTIRVTDGRVLSALAPGYENTDADGWKIVGVLVGVVRIGSQGMTTTYDFAQGAYADLAQVF